MARRDIFRNITNAPPPPAEPVVQPGFTTRGASRSMISSIGELAARADRFIEGKAIHDLDPDLLIASFMRDRLDEDAEALALLEQAIQERGQDSPILVRPHPSLPQQYQIVFGHRRVAVAKKLGRKVRAVISALSDQEHLIAQGQENSARANLSFIERAQFAENLLRAGYVKEVALTALAIDAPMLTRMSAVVRRVPVPVLLALGAMPGVGRDRWLSLAGLMEKPSHAQAAQDFIETQAFKEMTKAQRFDQLFALLRKLDTTRRKRQTAPPPSWQAWQSDDGQVDVAVKASSKATQIVISQKAGRAFSVFLAQQMERLYAEFKTQEKQPTIGE